MWFFLVVLESIILHIIYYMTIGIDLLVSIILIFLSKYIHFLEPQICIITIY